MCLMGYIQSNAMHSVNIIEYSIRKQTGRKFSQKFRTDYEEIFCDKFVSRQGFPSKIQKSNKNNCKNK